MLVRPTVDAQMDFSNLTERAHSKRPQDIWKQDAGHVHHMSMPDCLLVGSREESKAKQPKAKAKAKGKKEKDRGKEKPKPKVKSKKDLEMLMGYLAVSVRTEFPDFGLVGGRFSGKQPLWTFFAHHLGSAFCLSYLVGHCADGQIARAAWTPMHLGSEFCLRPLRPWPKCSSMVNQW